MDFSVLLQDPAFWASIIGLFYPKLFDMFEQLLQWTGAYSFFDTPARKSILAWLVAAPVAYMALAFVRWMWPESVEFNYDTMRLLAKTIVGIVTAGTLALPSYKRRGLLFSSKPIKSIWETRRDRAVG